MKFVIHEHHAKKAGLHWDIRLQFKVCKSKNDKAYYSFATRKLPDFVSGKLKRIMVFQTQNHECWWQDFQGELKQGYGAGMIYIWDSGQIKWISNETNKKTFCLEGKKVKGCFALIKVNYDPNKEWLLVKMKRR